MGLRRPALPYPARAVKRLYFGFRGARVESPWVSFDSSLGAGVVVRPQCVVRGCRVGRDTYLNRGAEMYASDIGPYCSLGHFCQIGPNEHAIDSLSTSAALYPAPVRRRMQEINAARTTLGADVWIGSRAVVLKGRTIGVGAVVAAGAVVAEDVAPYAIVGGVPARVIRMRFSAPDIEALLASAWWQLPSARLRAALEACDRAGEGVDVGAFCRLVGS